ncbi:MAG TPA: N-acetylmuramoyl-L-alanine amidase, partial [Porphyromonadaceae bacterium]|nr:N-acetylmuramoyl-L-alanine amidase [Porphyromonadaceae bacterium]
KEYKREYDKKNSVFTNANRQQASSASTVAPMTAGTEYRIQFLTSSRKYSNGAKVFKGLEPVDFYMDGQIYKYTYGRTTDPNEIKRMLKTVQKNFKDAFIIEFADGQRVK